ncbi:hypothetical protein TCAL_17454 [Tigriopus californicus]|uniref:C-type lectin domain-containing protein n=1 Tax=Tigriopus californicus TaxID=6832 RepID=A0A553NC26_TIGCA|nr:C-type lectin 9a-like [Tigriopus californicus]TRY62919.1 hypothetical protein TCAL_17454 [Tigriopus californicus]|eukprot:TCALIF_10950-PA protein Name:"Similar to C-type lectin 9a (Crotalus adamanteus)" AED:0.25 eAED:0.25 QI:61/0.66/0.5/0.75/0.66/0.75/4/0/286
MLAFGICLIFLCVSPAFSQTGCPGGYDRFGRKCIKYVSTNRNFQDAQADCQRASGGKLFEPVSKVDQDLVLYNPRASAASFIGLQVSGSNAQYSSNSMQVPFTDYFPNTPNNRGSCVVAFVPPTRIYTHKAWTDADCNGLHPYICEAGPTTCESDNTLFVGNFGPAQTPDLCKIICKFNPTCQFFIRRTTDGACGLRDFNPTIRVQIPTLTSGLKGEDATSGLLLAKQVTASSLQDCQSQCCSDSQCTSAIYNRNNMQCAFNYDQLARKLPLPANSGIASIPRTCP